MNKTDAKQSGPSRHPRSSSQPIAPGGAPVASQPVARSASSHWAGRGTPVVSAGAAVPPAGRTWAQVAAGVPASRGAAVVLAVRGAQPVERKSPPAAACPPPPDFGQFLAGCVLEQDDSAWETGRALAERLRASRTGDDVPQPLPLPALEAFCTAWAAEMARTRDEDARERLFDAMEGFLGGMPSRVRELTPLLQAVARLPLEQVAPLAFLVVDKVTVDQSDHEGVAAALALAREALAPAHRPALAVLACADALVQGAGTMDDAAWQAILGRYPAQQAPEGHLGVRMTIDPMAVFGEDTIARPQQRPLLDAIYAMPGLVTQRFIQGSFATAWGVEVAPELRIHLLDQLMQLGKAWVQPGHVRVGRIILEADHRYAGQPMPTAAVEQLLRWYQQVLPGATWDTSAQRAEFLEGERTGVQRIPVADPLAHARLMGWLGTSCEGAESGRQAGSPRAAPHTAAPSGGPGVGQLPAVSGLPSMSALQPRRSLQLTTQPLPPRPLDDDDEPDGR